MVKKMNFWENVTADLIDECQIQKVREYLFKMIKTFLLNQEAG